MGSKRNRKIGRRLLLDGPWWRIHPSVKSLHHHSTERVASVPHARGPIVQVGHMGMALSLAVFLPLFAAACGTRRVDGVDGVDGAAGTDGAIDRDGSIPPPSFGDAAVDDPLAESDASIGLRALRVVGQRCVGDPESSCHAARAGGTRLDLDPIRGDVVGVPAEERPDLVRARPGAPAQSYLWLKVAGDGGIDGSVMPPSSGVRDPRIEAVFRRWIEAGCPAP